jgi:hypothetical protein
MEMPKETYAHCMLIKDIDGSVQLHVCTKNSEEISEWEFYDLVPVPEPHGRLIDADALPWYLANTSVKYATYEDWERLCDAITAAPTIIPASEEGET